MKKTIAIISISICGLIFSCSLNTEKPANQVMGELDYRLDMVVNRITSGELPRITTDFLLAGLTLDPRFERRFTNYSGDQIGRYLSAMSLMDPGKQTIDLHSLVTSVLANQKADGRFGADTLGFNAEEIEGPQMALLWGNGRLLTGLLDYYEIYPERKEVLDAAVKLGDFLDGVTYACTRPEIIDRFKTMGALGFICFTQITEGMVKLYHATGTEKYVHVAEKIYPLLPEPGNQHSHGFLITLRGVVMLYEATKDTVHLSYVEKIFNELLSSENYMISGGVPEFFSFYTPSEYPHDEGCSEADFFMLCLQLWKATGSGKYLDQAEYSLMNHLLYNQFCSGDFGHHNIRMGYGMTTSPVPGQAWWCCSYHGLQALDEARKAAIMKDGDLRKINLFYPADWADDDMSFSMKKRSSDKPAFTILVEQATGNSRIAIRDPYWSSSVIITLNGTEVQGREQDGYLVIDKPLNRGDKIDFSFQPELRLVDYHRAEIPLSGLSDSPIRAAMIWGPWLLSVDDITQTLFLAELSENNIIYINPGETPMHAAPELIPAGSFNAESYLSFSFLKEGTSQEGNVVLRPISEVSFQGPSNVRYWFNFARKN